MELMIYNQDNPGVLPEIRWNYEEIKQYAITKAQEYQSIAYTDADVADMKKDKADINRFINALEDARKSKKKEYLAPYEKFEAQVKDALAPLKQTTVLISQKLDEVEQQYREGRRQKMMECYREHANDLHTLIPFEKTVKEEYYKRSFSDKKINQSYADFFGRIREELTALDELPERFRDKAVLKYMESFNLSDAILEGKRLEELEKTMEERRKRQKEEAAKLEAEKWRADQAAAHAVLVSSESVFQKPEPVVSVPVNNIQEKKEEPVLQLDFRVCGTREQLMGLRQYMIDNKIKFGKVE